MKRNHFIYLSPSADGRFQRCMARYGEGRAGRQGLRPQQGGAYLPHGLRASQAVYAQLENRRLTTNTCAAHIRTVNS